MREIGSYEAKTHLPAILRAVENGETIIITRNGERVARIIPEAEAALRETEAAAIIDRLWTARAKRTPMTVKDILSARDEGRR